MLTSSRLTSEAHDADHDHLVRCEGVKSPPDVKTPCYPPDERISAAGSDTTVGTVLGENGCDSSCPIDLPHVVLASRGMLGGQRTLLPPSTWQPPASSSSTSPPPKHTYTRMHTPAAAASELSPRTNQQRVRMVPLCQKECFALGHTPMSVICSELFVYYCNANSIPVRLNDSIVLDAAMRVCVLLMSGAV
jgi:hypothetical protein